MDRINWQIQEIFRSKFRGRQKVKSSVHFYKCVTPIIHYALAHKDLLWAENLFILYRPTNSWDSNYYGNVAVWSYDSPDGHFRFHYTEDNLNGDAVDGSDGLLNTVPQYIMDLAMYFEQVWSEEIGEMGYMPPKSDGTAGGGSDLFDVYVMDINANGYTSIENNRAYIVIHKDFIGFNQNEDPEGSQKGNMKVTAAHEFFHAIQYEYDEWYEGIGLNSNIWWEESTAVWMEDEVFDQVNDYLRYMEDKIKKLDLPLDDDSHSSQYGGVIWAKFLTETYGKDIIRHIFERCLEIDPPLARKAIEDILHSYGSDWGMAMSQFCLKNLTMDYEEGSLYPTIYNNIDALTGIITSEELETGYSTGNIDLMHLSCNYIKFQSDESIESDRSIYIKVNFDTVLSPIIFLAKDKSQTGIPTMNSLDLISPSLEMNFVLNQFGLNKLYKNAYLILINPHPTSDNFNYSLMIDYGPFLCDEDDSGSLDIIGSFVDIGEQVMIPIQFQDTPNSVYCFGFDVTYDTDFLAYNDFMTTDCVSHFDYFNVSMPESDTIQINGNGSFPIPQGTNCTIVYLYFTVIGCEQSNVWFTIEPQNLVEDIIDWSASGGCFKCNTEPPVPDIDPLPDIIEECEVNLVPPTATDNNFGTIIATTEDPLSYKKSGTYFITWVYDNGHGNTSIQKQNVTVFDTTPPIVTIDKKISLNRATIKAIASDNCIGELFYEWREGNEILGDKPILSKAFSKGIHRIELKVSDEIGNTITENVEFKISSKSYSNQNNFLFPLGIAFLPQTNFLPFSIANTFPTINIIPSGGNLSNINFISNPSIPNLLWNPIRESSTFFSPVQTIFQGYNNTAYFTFPTSYYMNMPLYSWLPSLSPSSVNYMPRLISELNFF